MTTDYRKLLMEYGYPADLVNGLSLKECQAEWDEFCTVCIPE
ncbi:MULTISPECIES: hypothetical protein [Paenibacillus]|nr:MULTISPECIES: hypothetical protein [Paenibacillus]